MGWKVLIILECDLKKNVREDRLERLIKEIKLTTIYRRLELLKFDTIRAGKQQGVTVRQGSPLLSVET